MQQRSRSPAFLDAVPEAKDGDGAEREAGSLVPRDVRCPNPKCRNKLAEQLRGTLIVTCRKCGQTSTIAR